MVPFHFGVSTRCQSKLPIAIATIPSERDGNFSAPRVVLTLRSPLQRHTVPGESLQSNLECVQCGCIYFGCEVQGRVLAGWVEVQARLIEGV